MLDKKYRTKKNKGILKTAVLVDIDGTLASPYHKGKRQLRPTAVSAIKLLAECAPVFLISLSGASNGHRLIDEFAELKPYISGCYGKEDIPLEVIETSYCIDNDGLDEIVFKCHHVIILNETYNGGPCSGSLMDAVKIIVDHISQEME